MNRITEAIKFAADAHDKQIRKLSDNPYIFHICEVGQLVTYMTKDEDTIIAALLHDTVEDTEVTMEQIEEKFGPRVKQLVSSDTEDKKRDRPASATWQERKEESLEELRNCRDIEAEKIWLADKLSNIRSIYIHYTMNGPETFNKFNEKDPKKHAWYYREIAKLLGRDLGDNKIYKEYVMLVEKLFKEY